jgi:hypothetical protein
VTGAIERGEGQAVVERSPLSLAEHILAMADDAYLIGHPEWLEIVKEARALFNPLMSR